VCALALLAMAIETLLGHPGTGSMIAAFLAAPWSMLVAGLAPPLPSDWPLAAGLAVRMVPLALFMLLNAAIVRGIAARSERDLARTVNRASVLLMLGALLGSGCMAVKRVDWAEGERLMLAHASLLKDEVRGDGKFTLLTATTPQITLNGGVQIEHLRLAAVFELR